MQRRIWVETGGALEAWDLARVALVREDFGGRLEVTAADGRVGHRPGPLQDFAGAPFVPVGDALVHPGHARVEGGTLLLPGGWRLPASGPLEPGAPPDPAEPSPLVGDTGLRRAEVLLLEKGDDGWAWVTDRGRVPAGPSGVRAARLHPELVLAGGRYANPGRVAQVREGRVLVLDGGRELEVPRGALRRWAASLRLPSLRRLGDELRPLYDEGLRDWPWQLVDASAAWLRAEFGTDRRRLLANAVWQVYRVRQKGGGERYGRGHRGLFYDPVVLLLARAGHLDPAALALEWELLVSASDRAWAELQDLLDRMVGEWRLFTFHELGFEDPRPEMREVGARRPSVVLLTEKSTVAREARETARHFGVSLYILGGQPSLLGTEYFLRALGESRITVLAYVDFDPWGWILVDTFVAQAARYGVEVTVVRYLVVPSRFTEAELEVLALPLPAPTKAVARQIADWLRRSGGVHGRARGLYSDHLRPVGRVIGAVREVTGWTS